MNTKEQMWNTFIEQHNRVFDRVKQLNFKVYPIEEVWISPFGCIERRCYYSENYTDAAILADDIVKTREQLKMPYIVYLNCCVYRTNNHNFYYEWLKYKQG